MSLINIANSMKQRARAQGKAAQSMPHGAHLTLRYSDNGLYTLIIQRPRKSKKPNAHLLWKREVETFARDFGATNDPQYTATIGNSETKYRAVVKWIEKVASPNDAHRIPQNEAEIAEWAKTLGQGVQIRGVDVFTGEL